MKKQLFTLAAVVGLGGAVAVAAPVSAEAPDCNWGTLTADAIDAGFDQGAHSSSFAGTRRVGLPNILGQGDLEATCVFIDSLLDP